MKKCEACDLTFEKGNFCKSCGKPLVELDTLLEGVVSDKEVQENLEESPIQEEVTQESQEEIEILEDVIEDNEISEDLVEENIASNEILENAASQVEAEVEDVITEDSDEILKEDIDDIIIESPTVKEKTSMDEGDVSKKKNKEKKSKEKKVKEKKVKEKKVKDKKNKEINDKDIIGEENNGEEKVKEKKVKKKKSKFKKFLLILLLILLMVIAAAMAYLNFFQVDLEPSEAIDVAELKDDILKNEFDGESFDFEVKKDVIEYFVKDWFEKDKVELPIGLTVKGIAYDVSKESILINVENAFIHSTLIFKPEVEFDQQMMKVTFKKISLGKFNLPLPSGFVLTQLDLPKNFEEGVLLPTFVKNASFDFADKMGTVTAELELKYFEDIFLESFDKPADYFEYGVTVNSDTKRIHEFFMEKDNWSEDHTKSFLQALASDEEMVVAYLALLDGKYAEELIDKYLMDSLYVDVLKKEKIINDYKEMAKEFEGNFTGYLESNKKEAYISQADEMLEKYYNYVYSNNLDDSITGFKGRPFDLGSKQFVDVLFKNQENYGDDDYILILDDYYFSGIDTEFGFLVYQDHLTYEWFDSKEDFLSDFDFDSTFMFEPISFYKKGFKDRRDIELAIANYEGFDEGVWVNYLAGDDESAFAVAAQVGDSQTLIQYTLIKEKGAWVVHNTYPDYYHVNDMVYDYMMTYDTLPFNLSVFPNKAIIDYYLWRYTPEEINEIKDYLFVEGYVDNNIALNYFRRMDDHLAIGFEDGSLFYFEFEEDAIDLFINFVIIEEPKDVSMAAIINSVESGKFPIFLFEQP